MKSEPSSECTTIDLDMKIKVRCKYKSGQILSTTALELGFSVSTVNTIMKDAAHIKEHVKITAMIMLMIITKRCKGVINEMEKLLMWVVAQMLKLVPLSIMMIQTIWLVYFDLIILSILHQTMAYASSIHNNPDAL
jgi:hypothetical protein